MSDIVNIHEAKTHLSRLLERVQRGATITIAKAGAPIAMLVPLGRAAGRQVRETTLRPAIPMNDRRARLRRVLEQEIWPQVPPEVQGVVLTREEEDRILGFGPDGA
jgi:prevent-host-death family protein